LAADNQGRRLLTLRKLPPEAGWWSIVGGKVDFLETLEQCAISEARQEVGVSRRRNLSARLALRHTITACRTKTNTPVSPAYLGQILSGEATNREPGKTREVRWFSLDELPSNLAMTARNAINAFTRQLFSRSGRAW